MSSIGTINLDMGLNYKQFNKDLKGVAPKATSMLTGAFGKLGMVAVGAFTAKAAFEFGKMSIKIASDLEEIQNVTDVTFRHMAETVNEFSKNALFDFGLSELSAKKYASYMGAMLKSTGIGIEQATDMSVEIAKLTADMASFYNLETDDIYGKIQSGLAGQTMPLQQLGISMNIANLEAYALSQGIEKSYQKMSQAEQTLLRYNYLLKASADSQGDFARNSYTWANQTKILSQQWQEFMGLIGSALTEILLPTVRLLNRILTALIAVTRQVGKLYAMITGKQVVAKSNDAIADSAGDAFESEKDLADGIGKAAKAATKALAPFDELNILQKDLGSGDSGGSSGGIGDTDRFEEITIGDGFGSGFGKMKDEGEELYVWLGDWNNRVGDLVASPITVPAPVFSPIQNPIYNPNWGLTPPMIPSPIFNPIPNPVYNPVWGLDTPPVAQPVFQPIPNRIYEPNWGLELPQISVPVFPAIEHGSYDKSLGTIKSNAEKMIEGIEKSIQKHRETVTSRLSTTWTDTETNYNKHKENMGIIATAVGTTMLANLSAKIVATGEFTNKALETIQKSFNTFGSNVGSIGAAAGSAIAGNISAGLQAANEGFGSFYRVTLPSLASWGSGALRIAGETGKGIAENITNGLKTAWDSFKNAMSAMGEKIRGFWSAHGNTVIKTTVVAGAVVGAGALSMAMPAAVPYIAGALGSLSAIPALAKGGIVDSPTLAMIGEAGKEAVIPLENNTGWINDLAMQVASVVNRTGQSGNNFNNDNRPLEIVIQAGETELARFVVGLLNDLFKQEGRILLNL